MKTNLILGSIVFSGGGNICGDSVAADLTDCLIVAERPTACVFAHKASVNKEKTNSPQRLLDIDSQ